jgi:hypothetical protein
MASLLTQIERVGTDTLTCHPRNARRGDIAMIAESLEQNAQYTPLIVQRSTGYVLAGNHTLLAARRLAWPEIDATYIDVTDEQAVRIMLSANRTSDAAGYDDPSLVDLLAGLPDLGGTGFDVSDLDDLQAAVEEVADAGDTADPDTDPAPEGMRQTHTLDEDASSYADTDTRMIILAYPLADFETMVTALADLAERYQVESNAAVVQHLVQKATATQ